MNKRLKRQYDEARKNRPPFWQKVKWFIRGKCTKCGGKLVAWNMEIMCNDCGRRMI